MPAVIKILPKYRCMTCFFFFLEIDLPQRKTLPNARLPQSWQPTIFPHDFARRGRGNDFWKIILDIDVLLLLREGERIVAPHAHAIAHG